MLELLQVQDGLVVLGDPGAGKTTFLKYLAKNLALGKGVALGLGDRLPFLVPISGYASALERSNCSIRLDDFIANYFQGIGADLPIKKVLTETLKQGSALILLDGLDEVRDTNLRNKVAERVADFYSWHHNSGNKFVLTSRLIGYREVRPLVPGLIECILVDFDDKDIDEFVIRWTRTLEIQAQGDTELARVDAEKERFGLREAVRRNPGVHQLASNPLLLTILALMKRQHVVLPERRVQLYDQYIRTLLSIWNRNKEMEYPSRHSIDLVIILKVLAAVAFWMHQVSPQVGGLVRYEDLRRQLRAIFEDQGEQDPEGRTSHFLQEVHDYAGLLVERGPDKYGFIQLRFKEYLAAVAIALKGQGQAEVIAQILDEHVGDPFWHEISLLTVGYVGLIQYQDRVAGRVVETLVTERPGKCSVQGEAVVLAGEAV